ncbi:NTP transferase domain-containing protein [Microbacterium sp. C448]|uniref:NTP transferase domain-containing protein n=1 Tax=Microbacterium sp. C448 TaxID=1177594 RepID=UPI000687EE71|nr:NTP transferase domain-containing protein [Microbacterium sp. C448]
MEAPRRGVTPGGFDAIVLAGGRASRLSGAQKPLLEVGGTALLTRTIAAARSAGAERIIVAAERMLDDPGVQWVREDPPFGGPVAAIIAALPRVEAEWTLVLACDLPGVDQALALLPLDAPNQDGAHLTDASGRSQWLTALYRTAALRDAAASVPDSGRDAPVRALVSGLRLVAVEAPLAATRDVDTWEDLEWARRLSDAPGEDVTVSESKTPSEGSDRTLPPEALDEWANALGERFELANDDVHVSLILDLARDVANGVARPAAPVSAFVAGLVAGRAGGSPESVREAVRAITELAEKWAEKR